MCSRVLRDIDGESQVISNQCVSDQFTRGRALRGRPVTDYCFTDYWLLKKVEAGWTLAQPASFCGISRILSRRSLLEETARMTICLTLLYIRRPVFRDATITREPSAKPSRKASDSLFCLALQGVFQALLLTETTGGLLPRLFTLIRPRPDGLFSVTLSVNRSFRHRSPALSHGMLPSCVRTFL